MLDREECLRHEVEEVRRHGRTSPQQEEGYFFSSELCGLDDMKRLKDGR